MYYFIRCPKCNNHDLIYKNNKYKCNKCNYKFSNNKKGSEKNVR